MRIALLVEAGGVKSACWLRLVVRIDRFLNNSADSKKSIHLDEIEGKIPRVNPMFRIR